MPVRFVCPQCNQTLRITARKVGKKVACPRCQTAIRVPTVEEGESQVAARKQSLEQAGKDPFSEFVVYDDADLVYESSAGEAAPTRGPALPVDTNKLAVPRWVLYTQGALLAVVALLAFVLGLHLGGESPPESAEAVPCRVEGRLEYRTAGGPSAPDAGAVVIVLPADLRPDEKLSIDGLRPDQPPPPGDHPSLLGIGILGGAYARSDEQGRFSVQLPRPGVYFVLFLSRHASRPSGIQPEGSHLAQLGRYFLPADELLGGNNYRWSSEKIRRDVQLDYVFASAAR